MSLLKLILTYFSSLIFLILLDACWILFFMVDLYKSQFASLLSIDSNQIQFKILPGLLVWGLIVAGSLIFVTSLTTKSDFVTTFLYGALFGLITYGIYDFTNYATLNGWWLKTTIVDIVWGMFLNGCLAVFIKFIIKKF